jgi:rhamnulokinase
MAMRRLLAFDLGAESGRALLGTIDGGRLTIEEKHRFGNPTGRMRGHLYWNLLGQWEHLKQGLRNCAGVRLDGIGVDTWGVDFGLIGRGGEVLGNPVHYRDARTEGVMEQTFARLPRERIFQSTGIQFMQLNSLYQLIAMQRTEPEVLKAAETLLFMPDLFNYLFTGERKSEFSIATTSQMYDPVRRDWAISMLEELGLPVGVLPTVVPSGTIIGPLSHEVAEECGVEAMPVIAPGCHDTASAVAAVPSESADSCYISSGTWSLMGVELDQPLINEKTLGYNCTNEGGVGGTFRLLKNIAGLWLVQECRRQFAQQGKEFSYAELTAAAEQAGDVPALLDPDHKPFLAPGEMATKIERYCRETNQPVPVRPGEFVRACLQSLALTYRKTMEMLQDILGRRIGVIHIVGGGSQNTLLNQMTADACGVPVVAGPVEATAIGNILVQAMALGDVKSLDELRAIVRQSFDVQRYEPARGGKWDQMYARFRELAG